MQNYLTSVYVPHHGFELFSFVDVWLLPCSYICEETFCFWINNHPWMSKEELVRIVETGYNSIDLIWLRFIICDQLSVLRFRFFQKVRLNKKKIFSWLYILSFCQWSVKMVYFPDENCNIYISSHYPYLCVN